MSFSSPIFLFLFFPAVVAGYYFARRELKNIFLLAASLLFYAWGEPRMIFLLLASAAANYVFGLLLERFRKFTQGRLLLLCALIWNFGILIRFWEPRLPYPKLRCRLESLFLRSARSLIVWIFIGSHAPHRKIPSIRGCISRFSLRFPWGRLRNTPCLRNNLGNSVFQQTPWPRLAGVSLPALQRR